MFTTHDAMERLVALKPNMSETECQKWFNKGSEAILAEVNRIIEVSTMWTEAQKDNVENVTTSAVESKGKRANRPAA